MKNLAADRLIRREVQDREAQPHSPLKLLFSAGAAADSLASAKGARNGGPRVAPCCADLTCCQTESGAPAGCGTSTALDVSHRPGYAQGRGGTGSAGRAASLPHAVTSGNEQADCGCLVTVTAQ
jgi:hypothetical protein